MKLISLLWGNMFRKPTRTSLTFVSLVIAFLLFMLLRAISDAFSGGVSLEGMDRIVIDSKYSMTDNLPLSYVQQIRSLDEVDQVTSMSWFGGYYREPRNSFATYPVDPESYFDIFPEQLISAETLGRFNNIRVSAVASEALAAQYGWNPGDTIPIIQDIFPQENGSWTWQFELAGTFEYSGGQLLLINYDYFNEAVIGWGKDQVGWLVGRVADPPEVDSTIQLIDGMFENSSDPTRSTTEDEYRRQFASQLGDIGTISGMILMAVFFTIILLTGNTAAQAFAERVPELATMKTLGFSDLSVAALVLAEAVALCVCGGMVGVGIALLLEPGLNANLSEMVGSFDMSGQSALYALGLATLLGLIIGAYPAISAKRLTIVDALRER
ncbi:MAG: ABC transporter permease [Gammaproteobacteria bacterium]|nr:ABC transporter permease [Gammaproteobacteria bacterium]MYH45372.1 ABC transporter permease [Gammaproteobacteria bacterium]MYL14183.1 ABC transporter permease [Gammaproteobacteria bacterium]